MLHTQITHESIAKLMDIFYTKVRYHENLGPIFNAKITESDECWEAHKEHIGRFWRQMLLGEMVFDGQPLKKHLELPPFPREFFNDWLKLFEDSLHKVYEPAIAQDILARAMGIAQRVQMMIYEMPH